MITLTDTQKKGLGVVRILLGIAMIVFGAIKFGADAKMQTMIGGAGAAMGLIFLSATTWFWIAVAGEIFSGLLILSGCKKLSKVGAILALIIMCFAINAEGINLNAILVSISALIVLILGPGAWNKCPCCKEGKCTIKTSCCGNSCHDDKKKDNCSVCGNNPCTCEVK